MRKPEQDHTHAFAPPERLELRPIGVVRSPYRERYGTPHQATALRGTRSGEPAEARVELFDWVPAEALDDLAGFERVWVIYAFHLNEGWVPKVRPPRGPRVKRGLFATRSPHRPCPIGLSAVQLVRVEGRSVYVRGIDMLDGTPVLDLKPYLPYADAFPDARAGWVDEVQAAEAEDEEDAGVGAGSDAGAGAGSGSGAGSESESGSGSGSGSGAGSESESESESGSGSSAGSGSESESESGSGSSAGSGSSLGSGSSVGSGSGAGSSVGAGSASGAGSGAGPESEGA